MPRKGENIRKRKDGRWEARYEKCRDQNGRIQYGYLYGRTYEAVKKKKLAVLCQNNLQNSPGKCYVFRNLSEEWMLSMRYAVKLSTYACYETLLDTHILPEFGDMPLKYISSASVYAFYGDRDGNSCYDDAGENIFGKVFLPISSQRGKQGKLHIVTSFSEKYFLLYTKESLQERSKAKVPGEKSWTKNNCHIIINAKLQ